MKVTYDPRTDTLTLILRAGATVAESDEDKPGPSPAHRLLARPVQRLVRRRDPKFSLQRFQGNRSPRPNFVQCCLDDS